jgi:hypothetical protein
MSITAFRLLLVHRKLDDEIRLHSKSRVPDMVRLQRLKKLKLAVKDRLHMLAVGHGRLRAV